MDLFLIGIFYLSTTPVYLINVLMMEKLDIVWVFCKSQSTEFIQRICLWNWINQGGCVGQNECEDDGKQNKAISGLLTV